MEVQEDRFEWMESLVKYTEEKALNPQGDIENYLFRIVQYIQGVVTNKIDQLNTRISEQAPNSQALEQLKLKYENLLERLNQIPTE